MVEREVEVVGGIAVIGSFFEVSSVLVLVRVAVIVIICYIGVGISVCCREGWYIC